MQTAFATKSEIWNVEQPMKLWSESHMLNKVIRPVHKPITRQLAEGTDSWKLVSLSIAWQVASHQSDPGRLLPFQIHVFRDIAANTIPTAPLPAKSLIASPPTLYCSLRSPARPTPSPPVGTRLATHPPHTHHCNTSLCCHDSETRMRGRTMF